MLLFACSILPMQAQYVNKVHRNDEYAEKVLQEAKLLYDECCYDMAEELLSSVEGKDLDQVQKHEAIISPLAACQTTCPVLYCF